MSDYLISLIRTFVPLAVGYGLAWLAAKVGFVVDEDTATQLKQAAAAVAAGVYYALVRLLESRWPVFGWLLGKAAPPAYAAAHASR